MTALLIALLSINPSFAQSYHQGAKLENMRLMNNILYAVHQYKADCGAYPAALENLVAKSEGESCAQWSGPYLHTLSKDPWGNAYAYQITGDTFKLESYGSGNASRKSRTKGAIVFVNDTQAESLRNTAEAK